MKSRFFIILKLVGVMAASLLAQPAWASCSFNSGSSIGKMNFTIPSLSLPQDVIVGTVLYTGQMSSATVKVTCNATGPIYQGYTGGISDADLVSDNPLSGVYATSVPGIGIRATWVNTGTASFDSGYIKPWSKGSSTVSHSAGTYTLNFNAIFQVVVTGPIAAGTLYATELVAKWQYDNLLVAELTFTNAKMDVVSNACTLVEKNITVPLKTITTNAFVSAYSPVVSGDEFKIELADCAPGLIVDFRFTSAGSNTVTKNNILSIQDGENAAKGVGIQIIGSSGNVVDFDKHYYANMKTVGKQSITIPLKARYIMLDSVQPGEVKALATFEIYYR
ncbi:fimbrial protein [Enterobacter soli]|uniref:fimbrial protein n=1 Tax=Enterobacter soli TaxID=885040 RepID=UPI0034CF22F2